MVCHFLDIPECLSSKESYVFSTLKDNAIITYFLTLGWQGSEETILKCLAIPPAFLMPEEQRSLAHVVVASSGLMREGPCPLPHRWHHKEVERLM